VSLPPPAPARFGRQRLDWLEAPSEFATKLPRWKTLSADEVMIEVARALIEELAPRHQPGDK
jgi:hypothetical protein